jgi:hypothetical protein
MVVFDAAACCRRRGRAGINEETGFRIQDSGLEAES